MTALRGHFHGLEHLNVSYAEYMMSIYRDKFTFMLSSAILLATNGFRETYHAGNMIRNFHCATESKTCCELYGAIKLIKKTA